MGRAREMPQGLTNEQRYAWVNGEMERMARSIHPGDRERSDERLMREAPEVVEPAVVDGYASWNVGHKDRPPHQEGVEVGPQPAAAPGLLARPQSLEGPRAPSFYPVEPWRPLPGVEVEAGEPTVVSRVARAEPTGRGASARPAGGTTSTRASASGAFRSGGPVPDAYASVRALSPEVAEYLKQKDSTPRADASAGAPQPDAELAGAQGQSARALLGAQLGRAGAMANEALTGTRVSAAWDGLEAQAGAPVRELGERRESARVQGRDARERARDARDTERFGREEDLYRADSERSRTARTAALLRFGPELARLPREEFERMSAADVADFVKGLEHDSDAASAERRHAESMRAQAEGRRLQAEEMRFRMDETTRARKEAADAKAGAVRERQDEKDLQELQKRMSGINEVADDISTLNGAIEKGGDIPGLGVWDSWKMNDPGFLAGAARTLFASEDDYRVASAARRLAGNENRAMTGLASSDKEREENMRRRNLNAGAEEKAAVQGIQSLARDTTTKHRNVEAGFMDQERRAQGEPDVLDKYQRNGGRTSADVPAPAATPTGRVRRDRNTGFVYAEMSDGSARRIR